MSELVFQEDYYNYISNLPYDVQPVVGKNLGLVPNHIPGQMGYTRDPLAPQAFQIPLPEPLTAPKPSMPRNPLHPEASIAIQHSRVFSNYKSPAPINMEDFNYDRNRALQKQLVTHSQPGSSSFSVRPRGPIKVPPPPARQPPVIPRTSQEARVRS